MCVCMRKKWTVRERKGEGGRSEGQSKGVREVYAKEQLLDPRDQTQVIRHERRHFYLLSHLYGPSIILSKLIL